MSKSAVRILAFIVVLFVSASSLPVTALAETTISVSEYNAQVLEMKQNLEEKYGIRINYPQTGENYAGIGTPTLITLDTCLGYVTPEVVKKLSAHYKERNGVPLTFTYTHTPDYEMDAVAAFSPGRSLVQIYTPRGGNASDITTGNGPLYIIHELGHAFYEYVAYEADEIELRRQWTALSAGSAANVYVSSYAATDYREDFSETFAYAFVSNRAGCSIAKYLKTSSGSLTALGNKVEFIRGMLTGYIPGSENAVKNLSKVYTTPEYMSYRNLSLSGSALQYIGYNEPLGVLKAIKAMLPFEATDTRWDIAVGGWVMLSSDGREYIAFPGGVYAELKQ